MDHCATLKKGVIKVGESSGNKCYYVANSKQVEVHERAITRWNRACGTPRIKLSASLETVAAWKLPRLNKTRPELRQKLSGWRTGAKKLITGWEEGATIGFGNLAISSRKEQTDYPKRERGRAWTNEKKGADGTSARTVFLNFQQKCGEPTLPLSF